MLNQAASATDDLPAATALLDQLEDLHTRHRQPLALLGLTAYATDAMRVLDRLQFHAELSAALDAALRSACPDWHNPGAVQEPTDLIHEVLQHTVGTLHGLFAEMELLSVSLRATLDSER